LTTVSKGNDYFVVHVEDTQDASFGKGSFGVRTGASHSYPDVDVIYTAVGSTPVTYSYITVRSWTNSADYVAQYDLSDPVSDFTVYRMGDYCALTELSTGYRAVYTLAAAAPGPDDLTITQDIEAFGSTEAGSYVRFKITVQNDSGGDLDLGLRAMLDTRPNGDDDNAFKEELPAGSWTNTAQND
jgi:hypothetical protein